MAGPARAASLLPLMRPLLPASGLQKRGVDGGHWRTGHPTEAGGRANQRKAWHLGHERKSVSSACGRERVLLLLTWAPDTHFGTFHPFQRFDVNRTLLPLLSLSVLVCENGPAVPSQREALRTTRCFAGIWCSGQFQWFLVEGGALSSHPHPAPQHLGDTCRPVAPCIRPGRPGAGSQPLHPATCGPCTVPTP